MVEFRLETSTSYEGGRRIVTVRKIPIIKEKTIIRSIGGKTPTKTGRGFGRSPVYTLEGVTPIIDTSKRVIGLKSIVGGQVQQVSQIPSSISPIRKVDPSSLSAAERAGRTIGDATAGDVLLETRAWVESEKAAGRSPTPQEQFKYMESVGIEYSERGLPDSLKRELFTTAKSKYQETYDLFSEGVGKKYSDLSSQFLKGDITESKFKFKSEDLFDTANLFLQYEADKLNVDIGKEFQFRGDMIQSLESRRDIIKTPKFEMIGEIRPQDKTKFESAFYSLSQAARKDTGGYSKDLFGTIKAGGASLGLVGLSVGATVAETLNPLTYWGIYKDDPELQKNINVLYMPLADPKRAFNVSTSILKSPAAIVGGVMGIGAYSASSPEDVVGKAIGIYATGSLLSYSKLKFYDPLKAKFKTTFFKDYVPVKETGVKFIPDYTVQTKTKDLFKFEGGKAKTIHVTVADLPDEFIAQSQSGVGGFRKQYELYQFYKSSPSVARETQAYLGYAGVLDDPLKAYSEKRVLFQPKIKAWVFDDYISTTPKNIKGLDVKSINIYQGQKSGATFVPAENIAGMSMEGQFITPAKYVDDLGFKIKGYESFEGSIIKKTGDPSIKTFYIQEMQNPYSNIIAKKVWDVFGVKNKYFEIELIKAQTLPVKSIGSQVKAAGLVEKGSTLALTSSYYSPVSYKITSLPSIFASSLAVGYNVGRGLMSGSIIDEPFVESPVSVSKVYKRYSSPLISSRQIVLSSSASLLSSPVSSIVSSRGRSRGRGSRGGSRVSSPVSSLGSPVSSFRSSFKSPSLSISPYPYSSRGRYYYKVPPPPPYYSPFPMFKQLKAERKGKRSSVLVYFTPFYTADLTAVMFGQKGKKPKEEELLLGIKARPLLF